MKIRINGKPIDEPVNSVEIQKIHVSDVAAWLVIILGILAAYGWWSLWR